MLSAFIYIKSVRLRFLFNIKRSCIINNITSTYIIQMMRYHILGGGIGGLAVAHLLSKKHPTSEVIVYEKRDIVGGQARSTRDNSGRFQEYCWHAFGTAYKNLFSLLEEAGVKKNLVPVGKYIYDSETLQPYIEYNHSFLGTGNLLKTKEAFEAQGVVFTLWDTIEIVRIYLQIKKVPYLNKIDFDKEDDISWEEFIKNIKDAKLKHWLIGFPSIYLGMEACQVSAGTVLNIARSSTGAGKTHDFLIPNGPINDKILDPWVKYLKEKHGVKFFMNTEIKSIDVHDELITKISCINRSMFLQPGLDIVINSLDVGGWTNLIHRTDTNNSKFSEYKARWRELRSKSYQIQTQVLFELNEYIDWKESNGVLLICMESPWCLMVRVESNIWTPQEGELLSCGIGRWDVRSELFDKLPINMNSDEIAQECWHQLCKYGKNVFSSSNVVKGKISNMSIKDIGYSDARMWPYSFYEDMIQTDEPKFSNNVGCYKLRETSKDSYFSNVYHSNAYTKQKDYKHTNPDLFCMENAATIAHVTASMI